MVKSRPLITRNFERNRPDQSSMLLSSSPRSSQSIPTETPTKQNLSSFAPWDRNQLVGRLSTFKDVLWSSLPEELCELEWARRGWVERSDGKKGIMCGLCHADVEIIWNWNRLREVVFQQRESQKSAQQAAANGNDTDENVSSNVTAGSPHPEPCSSNSEDLYLKEATDDSDSTNFLQAHYTPLLSAGHTVKCPWRTRKTDLNVLRLPPTSLSLPSLISHLSTLSPILSFLPDTSEISPPKPLPVSLPAGLQEFDPRLVQAAITGWYGGRLGDKGILRCTTCHRRVGLWLFKSPSEGDENILDLDVGPLDLITEHKSYCPWINGQVQGGMAGWEYVYEVIEPRGSLKRSRDGNDAEKSSRFKRLRDMLKGIKK